MSCLFSLCVLKKCSLVLTWERKSLMSFTFLSIKWKWRQWKTGTYSIFNVKEYILLKHWDDEVMNNGNTMQNPLLYALQSTRKRSQWDPSSRNSMNKKWNRQAIWRWEMRQSEKLGADVLTKNGPPILGTNMAPSIKFEKAFTIPASWVPQGIWVIIFPRVLSVINNRNDANVHQWQDTQRCCGHGSTCGVSYHLTMWLHLNKHYPMERQVPYNPQRGIPCVSTQRHKILNVLCIDWYRSKVTLWITKAIKKYEIQLNASSCRQIEANGIKKSNIWALFSLKMVTGSIDGWFMDVLCILKQCTQVYFINCSCISWVRNFKMSVKIKQSESGVLGTSTDTKKFLRIYS